MGQAGPSRKVDIYWTTWHLIKEDGHLHNYQQESFKFFKYGVFYMKLRSIPSYMVSVYPEFSCNWQKCKKNREGGKRIIKLFENKFPVCICSPTIL